MLPSGEEGARVAVGRGVLVGAGVGTVVAEAVRVGVGEGVMGGFGRGVADLGTAVGEGVGVPGRACTLAAVVNDAASASNAIAGLSTSNGIYMVEHVHATSRTRVTAADIYWISFSAIDA